MKQLANPLILKWVKYDHNFAGVGAGHAREPLGRGHGPLLQLALLLMQIGISHQRRAPKWLVMLGCEKNFLLTYKTYAARQKFFLRLAFGRTLNF